MRGEAQIRMIVGIIGFTLGTALPVDSFATTTAAELQAHSSRAIAVVSDPHFAAWRQTLEAQAETAQAIRKTGGIAEACGTNDQLRDLAQRSHTLRMRLLESLQDRGVGPTPPPPGVAPWPWSTAAGATLATAGFDSLNTAVLPDDGRIVFTNLRGAPEVDIYLASQAFYAGHEDEYDFLVIFTSFFSDLLGGQFRAFHLPVANQIEGLGYRNTTSGEFFDQRELFTDRQEAGALQSFVHMNFLDLYPNDPLDLYWRTYSAVAFMAHEMGHRWSARLRLWLPTGGVQSVLLGRGNVHWSFFFNSGASVLEGNEWVDEFGVLRSASSTRAFGPLDLYLMGLLHPSEIPLDQLWYLREVEACDPELDLLGNLRSPVSPPEENVSCLAGKSSFNMENIFLANGLRRPLFPDTQRDFRMATVLVVSDDGVRPGDLEKIERFRSAVKVFFNEKTLGRGSLDDRLRSMPARVVFQHRVQGHVENPQTAIEIQTGVELVQRSLPTSLEDLTLTLFYSVDGTPFVSVTMERGENDLYRGFIPAQPIDSTIRYYLRAASDFPGHEFFWPENAPAGSFEFRIVPDTQAPTIEHLPRKRHSRQAEALLVRALVRDEHGVDEVRIEFRVTGGALQSQTLPPQGVSDVYEGRVELPGRVGDLVEYRIVARDVSSTPHLAVAPSNGFYAIELTLPQFEDVEDDDPLWSHRSLKIDGPDQWHREPINHTPGGRRSWKCGPENVSSFPRAGEIELEQDAVLTTPALRLFADWQLRFWHRFYFRLAPPDADDSAVDGAILEWQDVENSEDVLADRWYLIDPVDGYNNQFGSYALFNALRGYPCWSGEQDFWKLERVDPTVTFHEFAGRMIRFRFRVATSIPVFLTTPRAGWYIDDIEIDPGSPTTPIALESFNVELIEDGARLTWRVRGAQTGNSFRIYRARLETGGRPGTFERISTLPASPSITEYAFIDETARVDQDHAYRLGVVSNGVEELTPHVVAGGRVLRFHLARNQPNPFNPSTEIHFELPQRAPTQLVIYDVHGRRICSLVNGNLESGRHRVAWDGRDAQGRPVASGVYLYRLTSMGRSASHRMLLVR